MKWFKVFSAGVLTSEDFIRAVEVSGKRLCIVKSAGKFYALSNRCPHAGAELSKGWCSAGHIICSYHRHKFDLETGRGAAGQNNYVNTYPVEIKSDGLYVGISKPWWVLW